MGKTHLPLKAFKDIVHNRRKGWRSVLQQQMHLPKLGSQNRAQPNREVKRAILPGY
jgi:hypothetical protein